jgi:predicted RNase H-like HicB family nuclease
MTIDGLAEGLKVMRHYIALIHKDADSGYGVSFPDVPGVVAVADTLDDARVEAEVALAFAAESWREDAKQSFPGPRTLEALRNDTEFLAVSADAVVAAIPLSEKIGEAA